MSEHVAKKIVYRNKNATTLYCHKRNKCNKEDSKGILNRLRMSATRFIEDGKKND